jgi:aspartyl-tRNA(Asn)/glutamyl-tRNA(Gln) amidotransferase subunit A
MQASRELTITAAIDQMKAGRLTARNLVASCIERIRQRENIIHAWVEVCETEALKAADRCDTELGMGRWLGGLHGIPIGIKDIIDVKGMWTRAGCDVYPARVAEADAPVVKRLRDAGAIILGKTETTAFANNDPTITRNPWNPEHTPGGSSSGSGAAVAERMCMAALASQTGGSLIRPAAYNGIVGFKPTYGFVDLSGVIPVSWGLDTVGPYARSVADVRILSGVLREERPNPFLRMPQNTEMMPDNIPSDPPRLGFIRDFFVDDVTPESVTHMESVQNRFERNGASVVELNLPKTFNFAAAVHRTIFDTELACYHRELFASRGNQYPPGIRERIEAGMKISGHEYVEAIRKREIFQKDMMELLSCVDAAITIATLSTAPLGLSSTGSPAANVPWSLCGFPAINLPSGLDSQGLPFGVQIVGRAWTDVTLAAVASWCENVLAFESKPEIF